MEFGYTMSNNQIFAKGRRPDRAGCGPDYTY